MQSETIKQLEPNEECGEVSEENNQHFERVCNQVTELMTSYKKQSEELKNQMAGMVRIYNQTADAQQAIPVDKIVEITKSYQQDMKQAQAEYAQLCQQLQSEHQERKTMVDEISQCFSKLEKMELKLKQKRQKKVKQQTKEMEIKVNDQTEPKNTEVNQKIHLESQNTQENKKFQQQKTLQNHKSSQEKDVENSTYNKLQK